MVFAAPAPGGSRGGGGCRGGEGTGRVQLNPPRVELHAPRLQPLWRVAGALLERRRRALLPRLELADVLLGGCCVVVVADVMLAGCVAVVLLLGGWCGVVAVVVLLLGGCCVVVAVVLLLAAGGVLQRRYSLPGLLVPHFPLLLLLLL